MYKVELSRTAMKALEDLPKGDLQKISKKIDGLETNPRPHKVEKLSGSDDLYRVRCGDYRIVYQIFDKKLIILVVNIGHRREIYRNL
jgi:mRNA interferase RelE/StbE